MKIPKLSPEQKARLKEIKAEYVKKALTFQEIDDKKALEVIEFVYSLGKRVMPKVFKVCSPYTAQRLANKLKGTKNKFYAFGTYLTIGWQSFYSFYDTFVEFGILPPVKFEKYHKLKQVVDSGIFLTIEFQYAIIICEKPIFCKKNDKGMHCIDGAAIKWRDGYEQYHVNGRRIEKCWAKKCLSGKLTQKEFLAETNDEKRSAAYLLMGEEKIMKLLNAELVDEVTITHENGEIEQIGLYKTKKALNTFKKKPYAWRKVVCPSTGTAYLTPTNPDLKKAIDVAKFHRPDFVPSKIDYTWFSRS
jgi:hypothetical protein